MVFEKVPSLLMSLVNRRAAASFNGISSADIPEAAPVSARGDKFFCGFSAARLEPYDIDKRSYMMAGFAPGIKAKGIHDPMTVNAMWLGCGGSGILWLTVDCVGLCSHEVNKIRQRLSGFAQKTGCLTINVSCSHSHAGLDTCGYWGKLPKTGRNKQLMNKLYDAACAVAAKAYNNRKPGKLLCGSIHVPDAIYRKRPPHTVNDTFTRLRFVPDNGSRELWFVNFGAHPNCLGRDNLYVSADYVYYMREKIKKDNGAFVMFTAGAIGACDVGQPETADRKLRTRLNGERLADAACKISNDAELEPSITLIRQPVVFPDDNDVLTFLNLIGVMNTEKCLCTVSKTGFGLLAEMTYINLGGKKILCLPGEMFAETVYGGYLCAEKSATGKAPSVNPVPLAAIAHDKDLMIVGVTNDMTGYVVPPNDFILHKTRPCLTAAVDRFGLGHYHETNSVGINTAQVIADRFEKMCEALENTNKTIKK